MGEHSSPMGEQRRRLGDPKGDNSTGCAATELTGSVGQLAENATPPAPDDKWSKSADEILNLPLPGGAAILDVGVPGTPAPQLGVRRTDVASGAGARTGDTDLCLCAPLVQSETLAFPNSAMSSVMSSELATSVILDTMMSDLRNMPASVGLWAVSVFICMISSSSSKRPSCHGNQQVRNQKTHGGAPGLIIMPRRRGRTTSRNKGS